MHRTLASLFSRGSGGAPHAGHLIVFWAQALLELAHPGGVAPENKGITEDEVRPQPSSSAARNGAPGVLSSKAAHARLAPEGRTKPGRLPFAPLLLGKDLVAGLTGDPSFVSGISDANAE